MTEYPVIGDGTHDGVLADIVEMPRVDKSGAPYCLYQFVWLFPDDMCFQSGRPFQASFIAIRSDWRSNDRQVINAIACTDVKGPFDMEKLLGRSNLIRTKAVKHKDKVYANVVGVGDIRPPRKIFSAVPFGFQRSKDRRRFS